MRVSASAKGPIAEGADFPSGQVCRLHLGGELALRKGTGLIFLSDDIRGELILKEGQAISQNEFTFFQALNL